MKAPRFLTASLALLCLAAPARAVMITHLAGDGISWLEATVLLGDDATGGSDLFDYAIPQGGILSLGVGRVADGYRCIIYPDDTEGSLPANDVLLIPAEFSVLSFSGFLTYPVYYVKNFGSYFCISAAEFGEESTATAASLAIVNTPETACTAGLLAAALALVGMVARTGAGRA